MAYRPIIAVCKYLEVNPFVKIVETLDNVSKNWGLYVTVGKLVTNSLTPLILSTKAEPFVVLTPKV